MGPAHKMINFLTGWFDEIALQLLLHYTLYILLVVFAKPENVRSLGVHETVGDCNAVSSQYSTIGQVGINNTKKKEDKIIQTNFISFHNF